MSRRKRPFLAISFLLLAVAAPVDADVIHLRNGGTVTADAWEERGENLIIHQGSSILVVPRADVLRIETNPSPDKPPPVKVQIEYSRESTPPKTQRSLKDLTVDEVQTRIRELKKRLRENPDGREKRVREIVALLNHLGERAYRERDLGSAQAWFREAHNHDRRDAVAQLGLAATYFAQGQDIYARSTLEQALLDHPRDPSLLLLLGDVYYSQDRPEDALETWEKAQGILPGDPVRNRIEKLRREHQIEESYRRSDAAHFTLKYDGRIAQADLGAEILQYLEDEFSAMVTRFDYYPRQPISIIVYPQRQFHEATLAERNVGGLFDGKIRVPIAGLKRLDPRARAVLIHELTHAFISGKSRRTAPRWLHEGLAQHVEGRSTPAAVGRSLAEEYRSMADAAAWGAGFSYPSSLSFVEHLIAREGFFRLLDALESMGEGVGAEEAFERATRYTLRELREAWGESLTRAHLH
ncbi:MAG: hypothetical protein V3U83_01090 [Acidobacteriota bacterium]